MMVRGHRIASGRNGRTMTAGAAICIAGGRHPRRRDDRYHRGRAHAVHVDYILERFQLSARAKGSKSPPPFIGSVRAHALRSTSATSPGLAATATRSDGGAWRRADTAGDSECSAVRPWRLVDEEIGPAPRRSGSDARRSTVRRHGSACCPPPRTTTPDGRSPPAAAGSVMAGPTSGASTSHR